MPAVLAYVRLNELITGRDRANKMEKGKEGMQVGVQNAEKNMELESGPPGAFQQCIVFGSL